MLGINYLPTARKNMSWGMNYPPKKHLYLIHKLIKAIHKSHSPYIESESKQQAPTLILRGSIRIFLIWKIDFLSLNVALLPSTNTPPILILLLHRYKNYQYGEVSIESTTLLELVGAIITAVRSVMQECCGANKATCLNASSISFWRVMHLDMQLDLENESHLETWPPL